MRTPLLLGLLVALPASAKDQAGQFGLGADAALTGGPAMHVTYWPSSTLGIQGSFGAYTLRVGDTNTYTTATIGGALILKLVDGEDANLGFHIPVSITGMDVSIVRLQPGIRPEFWVTDNLSFHATAGLTIAADSTQNGTQPTTTVAIGGTGLLGSAGFTFYL